MDSGQSGPTVRHLHRIIGPLGAGGLSDAQLVERWVTGRDDAAFEVLVWRYGPMVLGVCRRVLHQEHDAEDAFQATFLALVRKAGSISKREALGSWLYKVAYRVALQAKTRAAKRAGYQKEGVDLHAAQAAPDVTGRDLWPVLDEEVSRLPGKYRLPFVLCYLDGKTTDEAARLLGCPRGTVATRLAWARKCLRARLARRGLASSSVLLAAVPSQAATPAIPVTLVRAATRAALLSAAGEGAGAIPAQVAALVEGVLKAMFVTKLRATALWVLTLGLLAAGAGVAAHHALTRGGPGAQQEGGPNVPAGGSGGLEFEGDRPARTDRHGDLLPAGAVARLGTVRLRPAGGASCVTFSPDGKLMASGGRGKITFWDPVTGKELRQFRCQEGQQHEFLSLAFSPDGRLLASGGWEGVIRLWEAATGKELRQWVGHRNNNHVESLAFSPDGTLLASGAGFGDMTVALWEVASGKELHRFPGRAVAFSPDGKLLASATWYEKSLDREGRPDERVVRLWEVATGKEVRQLRGNEKGVYAVAISPDGTLVASGGVDRTVRIWEAATGKEVRQLKGHGSYPGPRIDSDARPMDGATWVAFSGDGKTLASAGWDGTVRFWDVAAGKEVYRLAGRTAALSPDGKTLATFGAAIHLWDAVTGKDLHPFGAHMGGIAFLVFSADGQTVTSGGGGTVRLWEAATGKELRGFEQQGWLYSHAVSPDGKTAAAGDWDNEARRPVIRSWEMATGKELPPFGKEEVWPHGLTFSPDGKALAFGDGDGPVRLWDLPTGKELRQFPGESRHFTNALAFSPDGKTLATGVTRMGDRIEDWKVFVRLWEVATGQRLRQFEIGGPYHCVNVLAFSPDGKTLATGGCRSDDRPDAEAFFGVKLWDVASGKKLREFQRFEDRGDKVSAVAFSPDGRTLAAGGEDGSARLWEVATGQERRRFTGHRDQVSRLSFSPDGKALASGSSDTTILVWDLTGQRREGQSRAENQPPKELEALWTDLAGEDAGKAWQAILTLAAAPGQAVPFLRRQLRPAEPADPQRLRQLLGDLDSARFAERETASRELGKLGELAVPALRGLLEGDPSPEARQRAEQLLAQMEGQTLSAEQLQALRAVEVLEHIGTPEAGRILEALAGGAPEVRLTREAKASLGRLPARRAPGP